MRMIHTLLKKALTTALIPSAIARYTSVTMNIASNAENDLSSPGSMSKERTKDEAS